MEKYSCLSLRLNYAIWIALCFFSLGAYGERGGGGRGGPFISLHTSPMSDFDPDISGAPVVIGGIGFGSSTKTFRIGGGGGGGFLFNPTENVHFGLGYGGGVGEYQLTSWLFARLMIGGGGYALAKTVLETESQRVLRKLSSGGFVLFYPQLSAEIPIARSIKLAVIAGYFLPNVSRLQSFTVAANFVFGG